MSFPNILWVMGWTLLWLSSTAAPLAAQHLLQTERTVIYYADAQDLWEMDRRLHALKTLQAQTPGGLSDDQAILRLAGKVEGLLGRLCLIFRLSPEQAPPVHIFLLKNRRDFREPSPIFQAAGTRPASGHGSPRVCDEARGGAVFLSLPNLDPGILAQELTHFLLCTAAPGPLPGEVPETLPGLVGTRAK